ncbi:MAG: hypothetical protein J3R72DRAFT_521069 [Linnemannia gamsii]|nr:MAG: hypothetical protein J3R72DRAFT_521069 [Linnemannia gamsii]
MKLSHFSVVTIAFVACSLHTTMAALSVAIKTCTKTVVVQDINTSCKEFADANGCTLDDLLTWNTKLGPICDHNLDKGIALCVSVNVNTVAAIAIANSDDPSLSTSSALSPEATQEIIENNGSTPLSAVITQPLAMQSSSGSSPTAAAAPAAGVVIPSSTAKSGTVIVIHDSSALISRAASSALTLIVGVLVSIVLI